VATDTGLVGTTVLHYHIIERLGAGGMGEVYLAEDQRLGRRVALKFLSSRVSGDAEARERLIREAQAAALLRSPHIAVTYDLAEYDGALFIAMEYVEGEVLSKRIAAGPLPLSDALDIGLQLTDALDEAHARGIVHRDIKSANVMITDRQLVKVLDFGLAKFLKTPTVSENRTLASVSVPGLVLGTLNYMAPEQLNGAAVDHRADLFSTGVVLYEMLTAKLPFPGNTLGEIADRILNQEPEAIARFNYAVPDDLEAIVRKALQKRPDFRYQTARDFYLDLLTARRKFSSDSARRSAWLSPIDFADAASQLPMPPPAAEAPAKGLTVAVFSFANITGNAADDWIGQGIAESLTADLTRITSIAVVAREQIFELQRSLTELGRNVDDRQAIEMGRRLGDRIRITCEAIDVTTGRQRATVKLDGRLDDLFELQDRLVSELTANLSVEVKQQDLAAIEGVGTESMEAYQAFSRGMLNLRLAGRESMERAIALLERALELDPNYVDALVQLAGALELKSMFLATPDLLTRSLALTERAIALHPENADAHIQRGDTLLAMGRADDAVVALRRGVALKPDRAASYGSLARAYWLGKGQVDEAIAQFEEMLRLTPEAGYTHLQLAMLYTLRGDYAAAERVSRAAIRLQDQVMSGTTGLIIVGAHSRLGYVLYRQGKYEEAIAEYRRELQLLAVGDHFLRDRTSIELHQKLAAAYRRKGDAPTAEAHEREALTRFDARLAAGADEPFTRYYLATLFALRGDAEKAREHLELPLKELAAFTRWRVARDPDFEGMKGDARFSGLL
jgi:serine/threonine protein kinase/Tfp pilus assembly protein PilF